MTKNKRFTWLKQDVYAPQIVITDSLTGNDLTITDCYTLLNELYEENQALCDKCEKQKAYVIDTKMQSIKLHEENQKQEKIIRAYRTYINDFVKKEINERDYPICFDCKHQNGTWVNDREVDAWCQSKKTDDCDKTFECEYFEEF